MAERRSHSMVYLCPRTTILPPAFLPACIAPQTPQTPHGFQGQAHQEAVCTVFTAVLIAVTTQSSINAPP